MIIKKDITEQRVHDALQKLGIPNSDLKAHTVLIQDVLKALPNAEGCSDEECCHVLPKFHGASGPETEMIQQMIISQHHTICRLIDALNKKYNYS